MNVLLISTYEMGRQPFGVASPAAWLEREGCTVACIDLAVEKLRENRLGEADVVAFYVPMHTATRLAASVVPKIRALNPRAHLCFYGLYASINEPYLRRLGGETILGGEFEEGLVALCHRLKSEKSGERIAQTEPVVSLDRQQFLIPRRAGLPELEHYAKLHVTHGDLRTVGYTEASRGCKHACRHCSIVPVYNGTFRIVQRDVVLADVRQQVAAGAEHVTFGDPDFFNGPTHAMEIVEALQREFPRLTYDVTIKIEHLLRHRDRLRTLGDTGCLFVTTAVESVDEAILSRLDKGHTREDFFEAVRVCREAELPISPTFVAFNPWLTPEGYAELLEVLLDLDLVDHVAPIQYAIRLLIPASSKLLELDEVRALVGAFDETSLVYPWAHPDPQVDRLQEDVLSAVQEGQRQNESRRQIFRRVWKLAHEACASDANRIAKIAALDQAPPEATVPYLTEPWYC